MNAAAGTSGGCLLLPNKSPADENAMASTHPPNNEPAKQATGGRHDYVRHTEDCLEEAQVALILAFRRGQMDPENEARLSRRIVELSRLVSHA